MLTDGAPSPSATAMLDVCFQPYIASVCIICIIATVLHRLCFHPLAKFPGPKLAAATLWYEFYYDVIRRGQYFREIEKMHKRYGPIVRINPHELHINDPDFYPALYTSAVRKRNKWPWAARMFGNSTSTFSTVSHDQHRLRRAPLNPLFSKTMVKKLEPMILEHVHRLCTRLDEFCNSGKVLNIGLAFAVFAGDVISEYCFGTTFGQLQHPDFATDWVNEISAPSELAHLVKQAPFLVPCMRYIPRGLVQRFFPSIHRLYNIQEVRDSNVKFCCMTAKLWNQKMGAQIHGIMSNGKVKQKPMSSSPPCVFDSLLESSLPQNEKTVERLKGEGQTLIGAGTLTTANVLKTVLFHLLDNPSNLAIVQKELHQHDLIASNRIPPLEVMERLPYLTACITEGLRMAYGVSHRLQLISQNEHLEFREYTIPPGTPVGMTSVFMHDNPVHFPEPRKFRPERWLDAEHAKHLTRYFVPFSKGTRMCLGMHLAWVELYLVLGHILTRYRFKLFRTTVEDVEMAHDFFDPSPRVGSKGMRVVLERM